MTVDAGRGLSAAEVADRVARGLVNAVPTRPSRTVPQIIRANVLTRFNLLMSVLLAIVVACGAFRDALFGGVIVANALVGIVQELRAKRTLDRLAVLSAPHVFVVRDGEVSEVGVGDLVLDDVIELRPGGQIVADAETVSSDGLEVDESLLTGESDPVAKAVGDELMSGSFVVSGGGRARVAKVGADAYATRLAEEARRFTLVRSELRASVDRIVTWISWAVVPAGAALFWTQYDQVGATHGDIRKALVKATGGVVAMVPEGLILLLSVAFAVGVVRLARRRTLVQELPAIETLARVDVVCLDKTGTITSGAMVVADVVGPTGGEPDAEALAVLASMAGADRDPNPTQQAVRAWSDDHPAPDGAGRQPTRVVRFSSARKWSAAAYGDAGTWVFGAPEMVLDEGALAPVSDRIRAESEQGRRVLVLASSAAPLPDTADAPTLPEGLAPRAVVLIEDEVRPDAADTLAYFHAEGVVLKVISGDNPVTVGAVAARAGLPDADNVVDARTLPEDGPALAAAVEASTVFGRVSPHQKRAMVLALQSRGHVVAMTGDGVNDVLALKDADVGIAMASGSEATRAVAQLVLLDSNFSGLPGVVLEGRKVINNLQRVASLFLVKTTWAILLAIATSLLAVEYPFLPRHITIVSTGIIGIPSFFLALAPNTERVHQNFFGRVARVAVPAGVVTAAAVLTAYLGARARDGLTLTQEQTAATLVLVGMSVIVLIRTSRPWAAWKVALCLVVGGTASLTVTVPALRRWFQLDLPDAATMAVCAGLVAVGAWLLVAAELALRRFAPLRD